MARKNRKFTKTEELIFKAGLHEGYEICEQQHRETLALLRTTNHRLFDQLQKLDRDRPLLGTKGSVVVPVDLLERMLKGIPNYHRRYRYRKKIEKLTAV